MRRFGRNIRVTITSPKITPPGTPGTVGAQSGGTSLFLPNPNEVEITQLRVAFKVTKHINNEPNTCELEITNLNPSSRAAFQQKPLIVRVEAGYDGEYRHLFTGDIRYCASSLEDQDWVTKITLADGDRAFRHARVNKSYGPKTPVLTALKEAARSMGMDLPQEVLNNADLAKPLPVGVTLQGRARDELTRILAPYSLYWSIQDGRLQILPDEGAHPGQSYILEDGIIGSPAYGTPEKSGKPPTLKAEVLLRPELFPGQEIELHAKSVSGNFRLDTIEHTGDTHGDDWTSELELRPLGSALPKDKKAKRGSLL